MSRLPQAVLGVALLGAAAFWLLTAPSSVSPSDYDGLVGDAAGAGAEVVVEVAALDEVGEHPGVAVVALVPVAFRHNAIFSLNTTRENMDLAVQTISRREVTVWNTVWVADRDPRVLYDTVKTGTTITKGQDGATNFFRQRKYITLGDPVALAKGTGGAVVKAGGKSWYFLTADYAFGQALQADTTTVVKAAGGTVVGSVKHPLNASDFSSFLLQAQSSKAQILGLANAGARVNIRAHRSGEAAHVVSLWTRLASACAIGDRVRVFAGCDKSFETCRTKFNNGINFRGFPHMPGNDHLMSYGKRGAGMDGGSLFR